MQTSLLQRNPNLLIREDSISQKILLKKNRELEEITFKNTFESHDAYKMLCLRSGRNAVFLNLELVLLISPFLSRLTGELKACCLGPHDQVNISLDQFPPRLLNLLKRLLETGECVINSETEAKDLEDLIKALGLDITCFVGNSGPTVHGILEMVDLEVSDAGKNKTAGVSEPIEGTNSRSLDLNRSLEYQKKSPRKKLCSDRTKWVVKNQNQTCNTCHLSVNANQNHVCQNSNRKRFLTEDSNSERVRQSEKDKAWKKHESVVSNSDDDIENKDFPVEPKKKCTKFNNNENEVYPVSIGEDDINEGNKMSITPSLRYTTCPSSSPEQSTSSPPSSLVESLSPRPICLNVGDLAFASMHQNDQQEFKKCRVLEKEVNPRGCTYQIRFEGSNTKRRNATTTITMAGSQLAYFEPNKSKLSVGTRCIAIYCEEPGDVERFFPAIVAQSPNDFNGNRYLIFFDDGYNAYLPREDLREVVEPLAQVWKDGPCDPEFIKNYLEQFPNNPVLRLAVDEQVETLYLEEEEGWAKARVLEVDASLAKMSFGEEYEPEWIFIGSPRLKQIFDKSKNTKNGGRISEYKEKLKNDNRNNSNVKEEIIDDPSATADSGYGEPPKTKKRARAFRKCSGRGGKLPREKIKSKPREKIKSKPLRKTLNSQSKMANEALTLEDNDF